IIEGTKEQDEALARAKQPVKRRPGSAKALRPGGGATRCARATARREDAERQSRSRGLQPRMTRITRIFIRLSVKSEKSVVKISGVLHRGNKGTQAWAGGGSEDARPAV